MSETVVSAEAEALETIPASEGHTVGLPLLCLVAFATGIVAAVGAVLFRLMIGIVHNAFNLGILSAHYNANQFDPAHPFGPWIILVPIVGGLVVVWLVQTFAPEARGHGVPEVMYAIYHNNGNVRGIVAVIKSVASAISIGTGASVGREGPIIQIGASFGSTIARRLKFARWQKITLLAAGAGAGIAATFNTPLGGVLFAVELLLPELSSRTFLPVVVATATATNVARVALGLDPAFSVPLATTPMSHVIDPAQLTAFALLGLLAGLASWAFVALLAWAEDFFIALPGNVYTQNIVGMLVIGVLGYVSIVITGHNQTSGVGYATVQAILDQKMGAPLLAVILLMVALSAAKLIATCVSLGSGASGGIFSPCLFVGATLGAALGGLCDFLFPGAGFSIVEFAVVGMGALVGGATGASMTAIVMIFEMTRDYNVMVPLVLAVGISVSIRRSLITENIYTVKLRKRGRPIPTIRHTNMYLVQQSHELMSTRFIVLPITTSVSAALEAVLQEGMAHIIVSDGTRIAGYVRLGSQPYTPDRYADQTLKDLLFTDFVIAREHDIFNSVVARMNTRKRTFAIVVKDGYGVPRPEDVIGVIDSPEIAAAVIRNHYS
jgi:CIC family chloride channel protein